MSHTRFKKNRRRVSQGRGWDGEEPVLSTNDVLLELSPGLLSLYCPSLKMESKEANFNKARDIDFATPPHCLTAFGQLFNIDVWE